MQPNQDAELAQAFIESTTSYEIIAGEVQPVHTEARNVAQDIKQIDALTRELLAYQGPVFTVMTNPQGKWIQHTKHSNRLVALLGIDPDTIRGQFPACEFHPYVDLFLRLSAQDELYEWAAGSKHLTQAEWVGLAAPRFNAMVDAFRTEARSPAFQAKVRTHKNRVLKNSKSVRCYIDGLFKCYARMLVIRIDLGYRACTGLVPGSRAAAAHDWNLARAHRKQLIIYLNRDLNSALNRLMEKPVKVGYILRTEYGVEKGWHFHLMLLLDGDRCCQGTTISEVVGRHWDGSITHGDGLHFNCNHFKNRNKYKRDGIGQVHYADWAKRANLHLGAQYLVKLEYFTRPLLQGRDRSFGKGRLPKDKPNKMGRPRTVQPQTFMDGKRRRRPLVPITSAQDWNQPIARPLTRPILEHEVPY